MVPPEAWRLRSDPLQDDMPQLEPGGQVNRGPPCGWIPGIKESSGSQSISSGDAVAAHPARAQARQHYGIAEYEPPANPRRMSVAAGTDKPLRSGLNTLPGCLSFTISRIFRGVSRWQVQPDKHGSENSVVSRDWLFGAVPPRN